MYYNTCDRKIKNKNIEIAELISILLSCYAEYCTTRSFRDAQFNCH